MASILERAGLAEASQRNSALQVGLPICSCQLAPLLDIVNSGDGAQPGCKKLPANTRKQDNG
jgi:hypothetical protein